MRKRILALGCAAALALCCSGCEGGEITERWAPVRDGTITIAMVGDGEFCELAGTQEAVQLAAEDFYAEAGLHVEMRLYDDEADYRKALSLANEIAEDPNISAVIVKQELEYIDTVAEIYEEAEKPFIITNGCYNHTIEHGYDYMLVDFIHAEYAGNIIGSYILEQGYQRVAFCHSDTEYEEDELKGMAAALVGSDAALVDTVIGPYTQEDFNIAYARWEALGVDVICVSDYYSLNSDVVRMLREKGSSIPVISDYVMDTDENLEANGEYLDGTVIVPLYAMSVTTANDNDVPARFFDTYGMEMSEHAVQTYDLVMMLARQLAAEPADSAALMDGMKSPEGHAGIYGTIRFDKNGVLSLDKVSLLTFQDGVFQVIE